MREATRPSGQAISFARIVLLVWVGQLAVFFAMHRLFPCATSVWACFRDGGDFAIFYSAARAWLSGHNPYDVTGFITPPLSLLLPAVLSHLTIQRALFVFLCCNLILVPLALWCYTATLRLPISERLLLLTIAGLFISVHECVRGGNMDGIIFALLVAAFSVPRRLWGAPWLAASIGVKLYPILLLPVALRRRQWSFVAVTAILVPLLLLPFFKLWPAALQALFLRNGRYMPFSISPVTFFFAVRGQITPAFAQLDKTTRGGSLFSLLFWSATLAVALYRDQERDLSPHTLARYVPWMLALPSLVFSYVAVLALTVPASLMAKARMRSWQWAERVVLLGFVLLGVHIEHATEVMPLSYDTYSFFRFHAAAVQSFGVILMILGTCLSPSAEAVKE